jgi:hypothetical protein
MREVIPAARIREVRGSRSDSIWNGLIIGAGAGALVGLASNVLNDCDAHECGEAYAIPIGMGIGAAVGAGLDALWRHEPVLYRASETGRRLNIQVVAGKVTAAKVSWRLLTEPLSRLLHLRLVGALCGVNSRIDVRPAAEKNWNHCCHRACEDTYGKAGGTPSNPTHKRRVDPHSEFIESQT